VRTTIRLRLTLAHVLLFLIASILLVAGTYYLTARSTTSESDPRSRVEQQLGLPSGTLSGARPNASDLLPPRQLRNAMLGRVASGVQGQTRSQLLTRLILFSLVLLLALALVSFGLAWMVAGRSLRPLRRITERAKTLSEATLREPIALGGPHDELRELADTFDAMLLRLDAAFAAQRLFVANASHELRTPLTRIRAKLDVTLADSDGPRDLEGMAEVIRSAVDRSSRLIDALLTLATARGELHREPVALHHVTRAVVDEVEVQAARRRIEATSMLPATDVVGDRVLLEHLVRNLLDNALKHNVEGGWVTVDLGLRGEAAILHVANGGASIADDSTNALFVPLHRGTADRLHTAEGFGLGLAIVQAVVEAHGGSVTARALAEGGLSVHVILPPARGMAQPGLEPAPGQVAERQAALASGAFSRG